MLANLANNKLANAFLRALTKNTSFLANIFYIPTLKLIFNIDPFFATNFVFVPAPTASSIDVDLFKQFIKPYLEAQV